MDNFGQPKDLKDNAIGRGLNRIRLGEGENIHRVLFGPIKVQLLYYPALVEDSESGEHVQRMKIIKVPETGTPLATLASLEKRIRAKRGEKNPKSNLDPSPKWLYLVIDKNSDDYPKVQIAEYPWSVYDKLIKLEGETSTKSQKRLRHGLIFMYDVIITKTIEKGKSPQFGTKYSTQVDTENQYSGKVPSSYLGLNSIELTKYFKFEKFFTTEEWEAIQTSTINLEQEGEPDTPDQIEARLREFPIFLGATRTDGSYMFPSLESFKDQLEKLGLPFLEGENDIPESRSLKPGDEEEKEFGGEVEEEEGESEEDGKEVEETPFEEVDEDSNGDEDSDGDEDKGFQDPDGDEDEDEGFQDPEETEETEETKPTKKKKSTKKRVRKDKKNKKNKKTKKDLANEEDEEPNW